MRIRESKHRFDEMSYDCAEWCAVYINNVSSAVVEITHGVDRFSRESYNGLIQSMFIDTCGSWEYRNLSTLVLNRSGKLFCSIHMVTFQDGSDIWAIVYVNGQHVRDMVISN